MTSMLRFFFAVIVTVTSTCTDQSCSSNLPELTALEESEPLLVETNLLQTSHDSPVNHLAPRPSVQMLHRSVRRHAKRRGGCADCTVATCHVDGWCWGMADESTCTRNGGTFCGGSGGSSGVDGSGGSSGVDGSGGGAEGGSGAPTGFAQEILKAHNEYRLAHNANPLEWDDAVAKYAQEWADRCVFEHRSSNTYGENLFMSGGSNADGIGQKAADSWYSEVESMNWNDLSDHSSWMTTGHFTAMVWKSSTAMGCGLSPRHGCGINPNRIVVCNYQPPGNMDMPGAWEDNLEPAASLLQQNISEKMAGMKKSTRVPKVKPQMPKISGVAKHAYNKTKPASKRVAAQGDCADQCYDNFPCLWGGMCWGTADKDTCEGFDGSFCGGDCGCAGADYADYPCEVDGECQGLDINACVDQGGHYCGAYHGISTGDGGGSGGGSSGGDGGGLAECEPCTDSSQCANKQGFCCPYMHKCVASSSTMC